MAAGRKIEIPKNDWIERCEVRLCEQGFWRGAAIVEIAFTGTPNADSLLTARVIKALMTVKLPVTKAIRFVVIGDSFNAQDVQLALLAQSLAQYGFKIQLVHDGQQSYDWLTKHASWIIVRTDQPIVMTLCNEVWFQAGAELKDVMMPEPAGHVCFTFLSVAKGRFSPDEILDFFAESRRAWQMM